MYNNIHIPNKNIILNVYINYHKILYPIKKIVICVADNNFKEGFKEKKSVKEIRYIYGTNSENFQIIDKGEFLCRII